MGKRSRENMLRSRLGQTSCSPVYSVYGICTEAFPRSFYRVVNTPMYRTGSPSLTAEERRTQTLSVLGSCGLAGLNELEWPSAHHTAAAASGKTGGLARIVRMALGPNMASPRRPTSG